MTSDPDTDRLDCLDKIEMRDVARRLRPDITDAEFERMWNEFCDLKAAKALQ